MKKPKVSDWIDGSVKPVHVGLYQTIGRVNPTVYWRYWNGKYWGWGSVDKRDAYECRYHDSVIRSKGWRGLTTPAKP